MKKIIILSLLSTALLAKDMPTGDNDQYSGASYLYSYETKPENPSERVMTVPYNFNGYIGTNIEHKPGKSEIKFNSSGVYFITYIVRADKTTSMSLYLNDKIVLGSSYSIKRSAYGAETITGQIVMQVERDDVLTLRLIGGMNSFIEAASIALIQVA